MKPQIAFFFYTFFATTLLFARDKTDVLVMNNGDRLTCEIKGLDGGVLYAGFDYIQGTTPVDWSKVNRIESSQLFLVKTTDGTVYTGTLVTAETTGSRPVRIEVATNAATPVVLERRGIISIDPTSERFWHRFSGDINSGLIYSRGNQSTQYTLSARVDYPRERWAAGGSFASTLSGNSGANLATRNDESLYVRRSLRWSNWFYTGLGNILQSSEQGISLQSNVGGGIGHYLKNTNRASISLVGGFAFQNTQYSQTDSQQRSENSVALLAGAEVKIFKFKKTNLTLSANAFPSISQPGRIYSNANATYYVKLFDNFAWNASFYGSWDNQPPTHFSGSDYGTSSGIGFTFGNR